MARVPATYLFLQALCWLVWSHMLLLASSVSAQEMICDFAKAESYLDINNVRARIFNHGGLFFKEGPAVYEVPKNGGTNGLFNANIWISGEIESEFRAAGTNYGYGEFWPGVLDENGQPPEDCKPYDRIYNVSTLDFALYDSLGIVSPDMQDWPWQLGAPVKDGDGIADNYDLAAGDRPDLIGDQTLLWMMQDKSGPHTQSMTPAIGLSVIGMAAALKSEDPALSHATVYRYITRYQGNQPFEDVYIGMFVDPDLGDFADDYVGADTLRDMAIIYNADNEDGSSYGYGTAPPAIGIDVLQGPLVDKDGIDNNRDGQIDEANERLAMEVFMYNDELHEGYGGEIRRGHMRGRIFDGSPLQEGCVPYLGCVEGASMNPTTFMVPGDPVTGQFWSEVNYWQGIPENPSDRKLLLTSGPFVMQPGEVQDVVFGIVYGRGTDHLDSITKLRKADETVQTAWDAGVFNAPSSHEEIPDVAPQLLSPDQNAINQPTAVRFEWEDLPGIDAYLLEWATNPAFESPQIHIVKSKLINEGTRYQFPDNILDLDTLSEDAIYFWRVSPFNTRGIGPASEVFSFSTGKTTLASGSMLKVPDGRFAFLETQLPNGDPCDDANQGDPGCQAFGHNLVHNDPNSTNLYKIATSDNYRASDFIGYAPHDYEIRFTENGSYGYFRTWIADDQYSYTAYRIPFELWDLGPTVLGVENDPSDDVQMVVHANPDDREACKFEYVYNFSFDDWMGTPGWNGTYAATGYNAWAEAVGPLVETGNFGLCTPLDSITIPELNRTRLFSGLYFTGNRTAEGYRKEGPPVGTVIRIATSANGLTAPVPASPTDGTGFLDDRLTLRWNRVQETDTHIQISTNPVFSALVVNDTLDNVQSVELDSLSFATSYYWRVRSSIYSGPFTDWSKTWKFTVGTATGVEATANDVPQSFTIEPNYPNPFHQSTTFRLGLPQTGNLRIEAFNLLGQRVAIIADSYLNQGWHQIEWTPDGMSSGVYIVAATHESLRRTMKVIIVR